MDKAPPFSGLLTGLFHFITDSEDPSSLRWKNKAHLVNLCRVSVQRCVCVSNLKEKADSKNSLGVGYI